MTARERMSLGALGFIAIFAILGNLHFISGSNVGFKIVGRDSFGFSEMFINADQITGMPFIAAQTKYPLGCRVLAREGFIESPEQFQARMRREVEAEMKQAMDDATRQQQELMRAMGY